MCDIKVKVLRKEMRERLVIKDIILVGLHCNTLFVLSDM